MLSKHSRIRSTEVTPSNYTLDAFQLNSLASEFCAIVEFAKGKAFVYFQSDMIDEDVTNFLLALSSFRR